MLSFDFPIYRLLDQRISSQHGDQNARKATMQVGENQKFQLVIYQMNSNLFGYYDLISLFNILLRHVRSIRNIRH